MASEVTRHYKFTAKPGVISQFFLLARLPPSRQAASTSFLIEAIMQAFFNVVVGSTTTLAHHHSPAVTSFIDNVRAAVSSPLPDFDNVGLNTAWCLRQGLQIRAEEVDKRPCQNPNCMAPWEEGKVFYTKGGRRCETCYNYGLKFKRERSRETVQAALKLARHQAMPPLRCQNPNCMKPWNDKEDFHSQDEAAMRQMLHVQVAVQARAARKVVEAARGAAW